MKVLDLDMDYFMDSIAYDISEDSQERLSEQDYGDKVWTKARVVEFLENNLGLSKENKIKGRLVIGHNESLFFWKELLEAGNLTSPFEVIHVDSHADLGLRYPSWVYILDNLLRFPVEERPLHNTYEISNGNICREGIGDYLLFAIAYRWISKLTYCANPHGEKNDYIRYTLKNAVEKPIWNNPVENTIQLVYNDRVGRPDYNATEAEKKRYYSTAIKEPEVPFIIIPTVDDVKFTGDFDYIVLAQSPNYTPQSADFILDVLQEYIEVM